MKPIAHIRREYEHAGLREQDAAADPIELFEDWMHAAIAAKADEPTAMTLATADPTGKPAARIVLLKHYDEHGFCFFTNYLSAKGRQLKANTAASLLFYWPALERQVRIEGTVARTTAALSDEYFAGRPRGSQLAAWVSKQSRVIAGRRELEKALRDMEKRFKDRPVPRPPHWGGYVLHPTSIEFWQGRPNRLHDRLRYVRRGKTNKWKRERLAP